MPQSVGLWFIVRACLWFMTTKNTPTENLRIRDLQRLITPTKLKAELSLMSDALVQQIIDQRQAVRDIIDRKDHVY